MKKTIITLLLSKMILSASCGAYVDCTTANENAITNVKSTMTSNFQLVEKRIEDLNEAYKDYNKAIEDNNILYEENIQLKTEYLTILKEIDFEQKMIKEKIKQ